MNKNIIEQDTAILVGVGINEVLEESSLDELASLCQTCNIMEVGRAVQNRKGALDMTWGIGKGKVEEIRDLASQLGATCVVFDIELKGSWVRNLEKELHVAVLDRSQVILDIFAQRAQSMEGKLQVELAQLKYNLPRLIGSGGLLSKMRNAVGMRGPGEKKLELDKRTIRDDISALEQKIKKVASHRELNKQQSKKSGTKRVALVGYTNSGKSTLLNTLTKAGVDAEDKLFATLDAKTASLFLHSEDSHVGTKILVTDTVGFINRLPHEFIYAFESTLAEARHADLLLHVVDISNPEYEMQMDVVNNVLKKIKADHIPQIRVFNKIDAVHGAIPRADKNVVVISAKDNVGIEELKKRLV